MKLSVAVLVPVLLVLATQAWGATILSLPVTTPPTINGTVDPGEWQGAGFLAMPHGAIFAEHDAQYLYLLVDMFADTTQDQPSAGEAPDGDFYWTSFDVDLDHAITPNVDKNFGAPAGTTGPMMVQSYLGPGSWTTLSACSSTAAPGFGKTVIDPFADHTFWEMKFDRSEIAPSGSDVALMGMRVHSQTPSFDDWLGGEFDGDFSNLTLVVMTPEPASLTVVLLGGLLMLCRKRAG